MSTVESNIVRIAERRLHLVTDDEVQRLGLSDRTIRRRVEAGRLHRVLPGVLSTNAGPFDVPQRELALCLSIPDAVLSHTSAAGYWKIRRVPKDRVDVTVPQSTRVEDHRAVVHYSNRLPDHHVVDLVDGGRVTSVARTVFDLGGVLDEQGHLSVIEDVATGASAPTPSSARCTTTSAVEAAGAPRHGSVSPSSPSVPRGRRCRSSSWRSRKR